MQIKHIAAAAALAFAAFAAPAAATTTPFSLSDGGLTVTFTSNPNPNAFLISSDVAFVTLQGNVLIELFDANNELSLTFSHLVPAVIFDFALDNLGPSDLDWATFASGSLVDSGTMTAIPPVPGAFAEGHLEITGSLIDTLVLSSDDAGAFAIDNLLVFDNPEVAHFFNFDTPEPVGIALFGAGLAAAGAARRRRFLR